jgi:PKD repeat protein
VAWVEGSPARVHVARRLVGGQFEAPETLDTSSTQPASQPDIAVDGEGNVLVLWYIGATFTVRSAFKGANASSFDTPTTLDSGTGTSPPRLKANSSGQAIAVWTAPGANVHVARGTLSGGLDDSQEYNDSRTPRNPDVAINAAGDGVAVWESVGSPPQRVIGTYRFRSGSLPNGPSGYEVLPPVYSDDCGGVFPQAALDSTGRALATWTACHAPEDAVFAADRPAGASPKTWANVPTLASGDTLREASPVFDAQDTAVATWTGFGVVNGATRGASVPGTAFGAPAAVTPGGEGPTSKVMAGSPQGTSVTVWESKIGSDTFARAVVRPNAGPFGPTQTISEAGHVPSNPAIAVDLQGNAAAAWVDTDDGMARVKHAEYDATAPTISPTVPATGSTGVPVNMSATASDDWSPPAVSWRFGDGLTGNGSSVSHAYAVPGTYTVTATATDGGGNVTSAARTITVTGRPGVLPAQGETVLIGPVRGRAYYTFRRGAGNPKKNVRGAGGAVTPRVPSRLRPPRGYRRWRRLRANRLVPVRALVDTTRGAVRMVAAGNRNASRLYNAEFSKGAFQVSQTKRSSITTLTMRARDRFARRCRRAQDIQKAASRPRRRLFGRGRGRFRTRGRNSSATVRGTTWQVTDTCRGTFTTVRQGVVRVFDRVRRRNITLTAGKKYLARPKQRRRR